jgi:hypothetical protein
MAVTVAASFTDGRKGTKGKPEKFGSLLGKAFSLDSVFPVSSGALPQAKLECPLGAVRQHGQMN